MIQIRNLRGVGDADFAVMDHVRIPATGAKGRRLHGLLHAAHNALHRETAENEAMRCAEVMRRNTPPSSRLFQETLGFYSPSRGRCGHRLLQEKIKQLLAVCRREAAQADWAQEPMKQLAYLACGPADQMIEQAATLRYPACLKELQENEGMDRLQEDEELPLEIRIAHRFKALLMWEPSKEATVLIHNANRSFLREEPRPLRLDLGSAGIGEEARNAISRRRSEPDPALLKAAQDIEIRQGFTASTCSTGSSWIRRGSEETELENAPPAEAAAAALVLLLRSGNLHPHQTLYLLLRGGGKAWEKLNPVFQILNREKIYVIGCVPES